MAAVPAAVVAALVELDIAEIVVTQLVGQAVSGVLGAALAPELLELEQLSFRLTNTKALDPSISVSAFVRGHRDKAKSMDDVGAYGYSGELWQAMVDTAGNPLPAETLLQAFRRGFIPKEGLASESVSLQQGVYESDLKNKWLPILEKLQFQLPDPGTVTEARLRGYIKPAEFDQWMEQIGFDATVRNLIFVAAGVPISPSEGYAAFHRGLIPKDNPNPDTPSLAQIFRESRINDKYLEVWMALQEYLPPPRTITALLRAGSITLAEASDLFKKSGLNDHLAAAYIADASRQKTQAAKDLSRAEVLSMYAAGELTRQQAHDFLAGERLDEADIGFLLDFEDFKLVKAQVDALVSRVRTLYVGHKIQKQAAVDALANVGMAAELVDRYLRIWDQEAHATPVLLTTTQLANAAAKGWIDPLAAFEEIQGRGYDARDAWVLLAEHKTDMSDVPVPAGILSQK